MLVSSLLILYVLKVTIVYNIINDTLQLQLCSVEICTMVTALIRKDVDESGPNLILDAMPKISWNMCVQTQQNLIRIFRYTNLKAELRRIPSRRAIRAGCVFSL
jgi:hypothetical protein